MHKRLNGTLYGVDGNGIAGFIGLIGQPVDMQQMIAQVAFALQGISAGKNAFEHTDCRLFRLFFVVVNFMDLVVDGFRITKINTRRRSRFVPWRYRHG